MMLGLDAQADGLLVKVDGLLVKAVGGGKAWSWSEVMVSEWFAHSHKLRCVQGDSAGRHELIRVYRPLDCCPWGGHFGHQHGGFCASWTVRRSHYQSRCDCTQLRQPIPRCH